MPTFTEIDFPQPTARTDTRAYGINDRGDIVGTYDEFGVHDGFLYHDGVFTTIAVPSGTLTDVFGINNSGQLVGDYLTVGGQSRYHGFVYAGGEIHTIDVPDVFQTAATGINNRGQVVGIFDQIVEHSDRPPSVVQHGFLDTNDRFTVIDVPGARYTDVNGINDKDEIVGAYADNTGTHGFLYYKGHFTTIDAPGAVETHANGINDSGEIVGSYLDSNFHSHAFRDDHGKFVSIDEPKSSGPFYGTAAFGINDKGAIVGSYETTASIGGSQDHGFLLI